MTAGKTYTFDETYRRWALESSDWFPGAPHFYIPDEFRISLYTKNSAGQLVAVSGFQNQPEHGWQALDGEPDFQRFPPQFLAGSVGEFFTITETIEVLLDNAQFLPPGTRTRAACATGSFANNCGWGLDIVTDRGRQLRTASYAAQESGVYYLTVTRHEDETVKETVTDPSTGVVTIVDTGKGGPVYSPPGLADKWGIDLGFTGPFGVAYMQLLGGGLGSLKRAMPYYELSVQVHGPTLASLQIESREIGFLPGRFDYVVQVPSVRTEVTIAATAAHDDATVTINPADAQRHHRRSPDQRLPIPKQPGQRAQGDDHRDQGRRLGDLHNRTVPTLNNNGFAFIGSRARMLKLVAWSLGTAQAGGTLMAGTPGIVDGGGTVIP